MNLSRPLSVITPTLDGDVLTVLANHDGTFTTGQLHRVLARHSEAGIRKVLLRLTNQGVVRSQRVGQAFTYQLNHDHLSAAHIVGLARIQDTLLSRIRHELGSWEVPAVYAAVFGSVARGTMTPDSDLDLLLIRSDDDARWETQVHELVTAVANWVGNDTRPLEFTATEVAARGRDEPVLREIVRDGLTVAGTRTWLAAQLRKGRR